MSGCWLWARGTLNDGGYGRFSLKRNCYAAAHRVSWALHKGCIPLGMSVLHHCDNRACVNPSHLFLGDAKANSDDMHRKGRALVRARHPMAKLSDEQAAQIRGSEGRQRDIAAEFGVSHGLVWQIKSGRVWK